MIQLNKKTIGILFFQIKPDIKANILKSFQAKKMTNMEIVDAQDNQDLFEQLKLGQNWVQNKQNKLIVISEDDTLPFFYYSKLTHLIVCPGNKIETTSLSCQHNNPQILTMSVLEHNEQELFEIMQTFINTPFSNKDRHIQRINFITNNWLTNNNFAKHICRSKKYDIVLASDHAGWKVKQIIKHFLLQNNYSFLDLGCFNEQKANYGLYGMLGGYFLNNHLCKKVIAICGTGIGITNAASKFHSIRAKVCINENQVKLARHNWNINCLGMGARINSEQEIIQMTKIFLNTSYCHKNKKILHKFSHLFFNNLNLSQIKKQLQNFPQVESKNGYWK